MANDISNIISVLGTNAAHDVFDEVLKRINDFPDEKKTSCWSEVIPEIFFGVSVDAFDFDEMCGSKWVYPKDMEFLPGYSLVLMSAWGPVIKLAEWIALHLAKVDPLVVVSLEWIDEDNRSTRGEILSLLIKGKVVSFEAFLSDNDLEQKFGTTCEYCDDEKEAESRKKNGENVFTEEEIDSLLAAKSRAVRSKLHAKYPQFSAALKFA